MTYIEVNPEIIQALKARGYTSCHLVLLDPMHPTQAKVEIIPDYQKDFEVNLISLDSPDIHDYMDSDSPMTKYVIDQGYLKDNNPE